MTNFQVNDFVDIHTHILPGIDDGPKDDSESIAMAKCYESVGIKRVIATPHFLPGTAWAPSREKIIEATHDLQLRLDEEGIDLKIETGMEIAFHKKLEERILSEMLLSLAGSGYYLIEPSFQGEQGSLYESVESLLGKGIKIILAHPERVEDFQQRPQIIGRLVKLGMLVQVNTGSLLGYFGKESKATADFFLQEKWLHFVASDAHGHVKRHPINRTEFKDISAIIGGCEKLKDYITNSNRIFGF